jgi:hypothetical protein
MLGRSRLAALAEAGKARLDGNTAVLDQLAAATEAFETMFEIMPGTRPAPAAPTGKEEIFKDETPHVHAP